MCLRLLELELNLIGVVPAKAKPAPVQQQQPTGVWYKKGEEVPF